MQHRVDASRRVAREHERDAPHRIDGRGLCERACESIMRRDGSTVFLLSRSLALLERVEPEKGLASGVRWLTAQLNTLDNQLKSQSSAPSRSVRGDGIGGS